MARGKLWGYVASGARLFGVFGGPGGPGPAGGAGGGSGGSGGFGRGADGGAADGPGRPPQGVMAAPRALSRPELERVGWTDRPAGCGPQAQHVRVGEVVQRVLRGGGRAASVTVRVPDGLPVVAADARRLESALAGLVDHAIRRSPLGDRVLVRAEAVVDRSGGGAAAATGGAAADRAWVELRVVDRGASELPEARAWLLAGLRSDGPVGPVGSGGPVGPAGPGGAVGAGGSAGRGLVRAAGGRLAVEQTPGGGLTVVLILAVARD
ncbi:hypothetical protein ACFVHB_17560 [Kitasatospora sp. NPDC127111]|uniref:hypothetical protein n=1 Tax=Kitasatospora sp. NPDC127111 TaxID=3345363 RepID=UPI0036383EBA